MTQPIGAVSGLSRLAMPQFSNGMSKSNSADNALSFQNMLLDTLAQTSQMERQADSAMKTKLAGGDITQVEVFTAMKKAELSLKMMLQVRNKLLEAFNEVKQLRM